MNLITEMNMPLGEKEYKRLVSGDECQIEAKKAIKELLERTMESALQERLEETRDDQQRRTDRRNGYYERSLLSAFGYIEGIRVPRGRVARTLPRTISDKQETRERFSRDLLLAYSQRTTIYQIRCELANYDYLPELRRCSVPVLILQGDRDKDINTSLRKLWPEISEKPQISHETIEDAGHITNYDQPEAFLTSVSRFIAEVSRER